MTTARLLPDARAVLTAGEYSFFYEVPATYHITIIFNIIVGIIIVHCVT